jgi:3-dehydroquinate dehydratase-1
MICVSLAETSVRECLVSLKGVEFAEIRMDKIEDISSGIPAIFSRHPRLIATYRPGKIDNDRRCSAMMKAIEAGAAYVDIELDADDSYKKKIIEKARQKSCKVIISYHNWEKIPERAELEHIINWCFDSGADMAKIACRVVSSKDNARLLGLLNDVRPVVVVGIGQKGRISRIVAPFLGSPFTYASLAAGKESADGQIDWKSLKEIHQRLNDG